MMEIPDTTVPCDPGSVGWRPRTYVGLWILYVVLRIRLNINEGAFVFFLFDAFAFFAGLIWLASARKWKRGLCLLACLVLGIPVSMLIVHVQSRFTMARGDVVLQKIDEFNRDHGHYPKSLQELVPQYLPKVPRTCMGWIGGTFLYVADKNPVNGQPRFRLWYGAPMGVTERGMQYWSDEGGRWGVVGF